MNFTHKTLLYFVQSGQLGLEIDMALTNSYDHLPLLLMPSLILNVIMYEDNNYCLSTPSGGESTEVWSIVPSNSCK